LKSLRSHATQLAGRLEKLQQLDAQLATLPDEPRWDALIPVAPGSSLGFARGQITDTNTVLVKLGNEDATGEDYWVEYSAKQARAVAERKSAGMQRVSLSRSDVMV
jgi:prefoldin subunit 5